MNTAPPLKSRPITHPATLTTLTAGILTALAVTAAGAQSVPAPLPERYSDADRQEILFNPPLPENAANAALTNPNDGSRKLPKYKIPLDPPEIDLTSRDEVANFYHGVYMTHWQWYANATTDNANCIPGTTSRAFQESVGARINWFRRLVGNPFMVKIHAEATRKAQAGALVLGNNPANKHDQRPGTRCWTQDGMEGAWGNLGVDNKPGAADVNGYVRDLGENNVFAGHLKSILFHPVVGLGAGAFDGKDVNYGQWNMQTQANIVNLQFGRVPQSEQHHMNRTQAYPPVNSFMPRIILHGQTRWTYAHTDLKDLSRANVTVTRNGAPVDIEVVYRHNPANEYANITFDLPFDQARADVVANKGTEDIVYRVTITNAYDLANRPKEITYTVTGIDVFSGYPDWTGDKTAVMLDEWWSPERDTYFISPHNKNGTTREYRVYDPNTGLNFPRWEFVPAVRKDAYMIDDVIPSYYRTWRGFAVWNNRTDALAADPRARPVCRWYLVESASHFYSATQEDCDMMQRIYGHQPKVAVLDDPAAFWIVPPRSNGTCDAKYVPVTRLYNNNYGTGRPVNHRYTIHAADIRELTGRGWLNEGVVFCAPKKKEFNVDNAVTGGGGWFGE